MKFSIKNLQLTQMHSFPSLVMRYQHRSIFMSLRIDKSFNAIGNRIEGMKNVEESWAGRKNKVFAQCIDAPDSNEHSNWTTKCEKGLRVKTELWIIYKGLASSSSPQYVTDLSAESTFQYRSRHRCQKILYILGLK